MGTRALLGVKELLNVIFCDLFYFVILVAHVKNVDNRFAFGAREPRCQQRIIVGLLGIRGMNKIGYSCSED